MKTILLVDDEYSIVEVLTQLLEEEGYSVASAANGQEALELAGASVPDLIITDQMMPIMSGSELFRALSETATLARVPVILITSAPMAAPRDLRWAEFIVKPFEFDDLMRVIHRVLRDTKPRATRLM